MPPNPKRPQHEESVTDEQVLRADDPRPQRVAQLPSNPPPRRAPKRVEEHIPTSVFDTEADQELQAEYGVNPPEYKPAFLYVERGPGAGQLLEVKQGTVVVGRASVSDLRLQHPSISRRHTQLKRIGEQFFVKDLGSQNGTFANKQRIATEVEVKPGDNIALGNALLRLRGPLAKGEKLPQPVQQVQQQARPRPSDPAAESNTKSRVSTAVVARPAGLGQQPPPPPAPGSSTALKIAVFAGAVGFSLAAVLAFALVRNMTSGSSTNTASTGSTSAAVVPERTEKERLIDEAIKRKMAEAPSTEAAAVEPEATVTVKEQAAPVRVAPTVVAAPRVTAAPKVATVASPKPAASKPAPVASKSISSDDDDNEPAPAKGGAKRSQILAAYEKGNAEASLEAAKKAGDKELSDKLSKFIAAYDAANDAMMANNGTAAITNFQKALTLDEGLSSGWGKYGAEIRRQLSNLYVLVGIQFVSNGDTEKAKAAFQGALKHDPNNARAKQQLSKLGAAAPKSADEAFDDEPASPPAKKPASKGSSIDDAFGD